MSDALEAGYRRVLMMLPRTYRADHAEEMVSVLMDDAEPGQTRPKARDVLSVAMLSVRLRFAVRSAGESGTVAGDVARRAVLAFLVLNFGLLVQWNAFGADIGYSFVPVLLQAGVIAALILGWSWCGRVMCLAYGGYMIHNVRWGYWRFDSHWWYGEINVLAPLLALAMAVVVFHRGAPRVARPTLWFLAFAAITVAFWIRGKTVDHMWSFELAHTPALPALIYVAAAIVALRQAKSSPVWPSALALAGLPAAGGSMVRYLAGPIPILGDSPRNTFYVQLAIGSEFLLIGVAVASLLFSIHRHRTTLGLNRA